MDIHEHLTNGILDVELRLPGSEPAWTRFDLSGMISQVTLHGKHRFCQPEQTEKHPNRVTCYGFGLSSEFCMNELPSELPAGEKFPKPGVGILTQNHDIAVFKDFDHMHIILVFSLGKDISRDIGVAIGGSCRTVDSNIQVCHPFYRRFAILNL